MAPFYEFLNTYTTLLTTATPADYNYYVINALDNSLYELHTRTLDDFDNVAGFQQKLFQNASTISEYKYMYNHRCSAI